MGWAYSGMKTILIEACFLQCAREYYSGMGFLQRWQMHFQIRCSSYRGRGILQWWRWEWSFWWNTMVLTYKNVINNFYGYSKFNKVSALMTTLSYLQQCSIKYIYGTWQILMLLQWENPVVTTITLWN